MRKCQDCGEPFDVADDKETYDEYKDEFESQPYSPYDCVSCLIPDVGSNRSLGAAIQMLNGDADYEADAVDKWF